MRILAKKTQAEEKGEGREKKREADVPSPMSLAAMARARARAVSIWTGSLPGDAPQYTQILVRREAALGFRLDGVEVREAGNEGRGEAPPGAIVGAGVDSLGR